MKTCVVAGDRPRNHALGRRCRQRLHAVIAGGLVSAAMASLSPAFAQQAIVGPEDVVATGLSGFVDGPAPAGADPLDYRIINPDGPSARVVDMSALGAQGGLSPAPKPFTVTASQVGQVFGVALDDAPAPNLYLAATAVYGVTIGLADPSGLVKRLRQGESGADYLPGMFGPAALSGGPGSIWRVDGMTGEVSLFADVGDGLPASLGALAFDARSRQIFVADRASGLIHRLGLDGVERGRFDHGVEARPAAGLPEAPMIQVSVDIASADFDTEQPATWGFADPERLVFALAVHGERLYYSVAAGPEIWSVGIAPDGAFAADARLEVQSPVMMPGMEIASIAFDGEGRMYAAERAPPTGAYDFHAVAAGGEGRVLRFLPKPEDDGNPGFWLPDPQSYAIGLTPEFNNANGGVVLGRGHDRGGRIRLDQCRATLWSTGEALLGAGPSIDPVDGLQGNDPAQVLPANAPPTASWFVDYDDRAGDPLNAGHMGALAVPPCEGVRAEAPLPPPVVSCPVGTMLVGGTCLLPPRCPPGTRFRDGTCVFIGCPPNMVRVKGVCVPPPRVCDRYENFVNGRCVPWACPGDLVRLSNGYCGCPPREIYRRGKCVPPPHCPPDRILTRDGRCIPPPCPEFWQRDRAGRCIPPRCERPFVQDRFGRCICPPNLLLKKGRCVPPPIVQPCPQGMDRAPNGKCVCPPQLLLKKGRCVPPPIVQPCPQGMDRAPNGKCVCPPQLLLKKGRCVPPPIVQPCPKGMDRAPNGKCVCPPNLLLKKGRCVPPPIVQPCPKGMDRAPNGKCVCPPQLLLKKGRCVPPPIVQPCPKGMDRAPNGKCVCPPNLLLKKGRCVPPPIVQPCPKGMDRAPNGKCVCPQGQRLIKGVCRPPVVIDCAPGFVLKGGKCIAIGPVRPVPPKCDAGERLRNGKCIPVIKPGVVCKKGWIVKDGRCVKLGVEPPPGTPQPPPVRQPTIKVVPQNTLKLAPQQSAPQ